MKTETFYSFEFNFDYQVRHNCPFSSEFAKGCVPMRTAAALFPNEDSVPIWPNRHSFSSQPFPIRRVSFASPMSVCRHPSSFLAVLPMSAASALCFSPDQHVDHPPFQMPPLSYCSHYAANNVNAISYATAVNCNFNYPKMISPDIPSHHLDPLNSFDFSPSPPSFFVHPDQLQLFDTHHFVADYRQCLSACTDFFDQTLFECPFFPQCFKGLVGEMVNDCNSYKFGQYQLGNGGNERENHPKPLVPMPCSKSCVICWGLATALFCRFRDTIQTDCECNLTPSPAASAGGGVVPLLQCAPSFPTPSFFCKTSPPPSSSSAPSPIRQSHQQQKHHQPWSTTLCSSSQPNSSNYTPLLPPEVSAKVFCPPSAIDPKMCRRTARRSRHELNHKRVHHCTFGGCDKVYTKSSHLKAHQRLHTGEKPYTCPFPNCLWKFSRSDELTRHLRKHMGAKPFKCAQCMRSFARSDHLQLHLRRHG